MKKIIKFLGLPIITVDKFNNREKKYFLGIKYKESVIKHGSSFCDLLEYMNLNISDYAVKFITQNLGEAVVFARTYKNWYNGSDLIFVKNSAQFEIFNMICPELPVFFIGESFLKRKDERMAANIKSLLPDILLSKMTEEDPHFFVSWQKFLNKNLSDCFYTMFKISLAMEKIILNKLGMLKIDLLNLVLFISDAKSQFLLAEIFWVNLETKLKENNYHVIYNSPLFTITELYYLASKAKAVVSLRCGLNELLCELPVRQLILYTDNRIHHNLDTYYSLNGYPWTVSNYITEINCNDMKQEELIRFILGAITDNS